MGIRKKTPDEIQSIVREYHAGALVIDLAAKHGVCRATMQKYLNDAGVRNSPGQPTLRHRIRPPMKQLNLEPAFDYLRNLGDPSQTRLMHDLVNAHGLGYKWSSRGMFRRRIREWLNTPDGRFSQMARLMSIALAVGEAPDDQAKLSARRQLDHWLYNYSVNVPFNIANAAEELGLEVDVMTIKRWLLAQDT